MTQAPIEPHQKDMAANMLSQSYDRVLTIAQTLANLEAARAENERLRDRLEVVDGWSEDADGIACRDDTIKLQDARIEAMGKALAEIFDALRYAEGDDPKISAALAIAALYRASDPVAEALKKEAREIVANMPGLNALQSAAYRDGNWDEGGSVDIALAALKRGMALARTIEGDR